MSADTDGVTAGERMARDEYPLPDSIDACIYCGAGRDAQRHTKSDSNVAAHSHHGLRQTVISCDGCGGSHITTHHVQTRVNRPSRPTHKSNTWIIPDGFITCVCMDGCVIDHVRVDEERTYPDEFFEKLLDGELHCGCGATATWLRGRYERHANGEPKTDLPEPDR